MNKGLTDMLNRSRTLNTGETVEETEPLQLEELELNIDYE